MTHILISNDDGIDAPGLLALENLAAEFGKPVTFAPESQQSGVGHQVTVDKPIRVDQVSDHRFAVRGTPADCVRVAVSEFDFEFSMMLSGINSGGNLGVDIFMSGTAAAAREASYFGLKSFAISQYRSQKFEADWKHSARLTQKAIEFIQSKSSAGPGFWNINLPCTRVSRPANHDFPVRLCKVDRHPHAISYVNEQQSFVYDGVYQERPRDPASDVDLCFSGAITVSLCP